ncbi:MAG: hypothetical protein JNK82_08095 [Myxococcaceae bacterium]|nr:hypothetical protein [Myxococcaceae bacterium]
MTRSVANGVGGQYFYYKCSKKSRTANAACKVRDIPVDAVEKFVLSQVRGFAIDKKAVVKAVHHANAGRDELLARIREDLQEKRAAYLQASKVVAKLLDTLESEDKSAALESLRARLRDREAVKNQLKVEVGDLEAKERGLRQQMLDALTVAESYAKLPTIIDKAERIGAREELKALLYRIIDGIDWVQDPKDPKKGEALIKLCELPAEFGLERLKAARPGEPVNSSPGRQEWLPDLDSNQGHGD